MLGYVFIWTINQVRTINQVSGIEDVIQNVSTCHMVAHCSTEKESEINIFWFESEETRSAVSEVNVCQRFNHA